VMVPTINKARMNQLTSAQQRALHEAAQEAGEWFVAEQERQSEQDVERMKREHGASYRVIDLKPGVELMQPVVRQMESEGFVPKGLYDVVREELVTL
jgi:TRAP-type C4-dicarboxylate transport system substrate-binding protein